MLVPAPAHAALVRGRVVAAADRSPLPGASVSLEGAGKGALTDAEGRFAVLDVPPGVFNVRVELLGYARQVQYEVEVGPARPTELEFVLEVEVVGTDSISVTASPFTRRAASPVSLRTIGAAEIARFPGGGRDLSRALQGTPGIASTPNFRNDLIVRGGAPDENRFYLDGIEVPNINHFATQGSTGGPVGMIDVNFVREVDVYTGAFPASRGDALSSVMEFRLREGNAERLVTTVTLGASDFGLTLDGPLGERASGFLSLRRSYLQLVFQALGLPFLPTYNDAQFKIRFKPNGRDEFTLLGLGAADELTLDTDANDTEFKQYVLDFLPVTPQWNYTLGGKWTRTSATGIGTMVISRNELDNQATKYQDNDESDPANLVLDYRSTEAEDKWRYERNERRGAWQLEYGGGLERANYQTDTYQRTATPEGILDVDYESSLTFAKAALFAQASRAFADDRLTLSVGCRLDAADYSPETKRLAEQLSPRAAASWALSPRWRLNASAGRFLQLPAYTVLGFRDSTGTLANRERGATYIHADHLVAGLELATTTNSRITAETFFKRYGDYPFLLRDSISLANLGADFGVIGNAPSSPTSRGRAYGFELLALQRLYRGWYGIASYTFVRSEFTTRDGSYRPSAWDNRHLISFTGGRRFSRGIEVGARWRYLGGAPYTPDDVPLSSLREVWDVTGRGVPDYAQLNSQRNGQLHQLDVRFDKRWFTEGASIGLFLEVSNVYKYQPQLAPVLLVDRDANRAPVVDPADPSRYLMHYTRDDTASLLPTIGVTIEF